MEPGEALEAGAALVRSANRRERLLLEGAVRLERFARDDLAAFDSDDRIVVGGGSQAISGKWRFAVARCVVK